MFIVPAMTFKKKRILNYIPTLKELNHYSEAKKKQWMKKNASKDFVMCICECASNVLKGNVPLTNSQRKKLSCKKNSLRKLVNKRLGLKRKQKIIQRGGFLSALIGPIVSLLAGLIMPK